MSKLFSAVALMVSFQASAFAATEIAVCFEGSPREFVTNLDVQNEIKASRGMSATESLLKIDGTINVWFDQAAGVMVTDNGCGESKFDLDFSGAKTAGKSQLLTLDKVMKDPCAKGGHGEQVYRVYYTAIYNNQREAGSFTVYQATDKTCELTRVVEDRGW